MELDGFDDYVWIPNSSSLNISGSTITMEAKVKLNSTSSNHWIVCKQDIESIRSYGFYITTYGNTIAPSVQTTDERFEGEVGSGVLNYDTWYHIAVVYDGSKIKTYIDGQFNGEADLTGNLEQTDRDLHIVEKQFCRVA